MWNAQKWKVMKPKHCFVGFWSSDNEVAFRSPPFQTHNIFGCIGIDTLYLMHMHLDKKWYLVHDATIIKSEKYNNIVCMIS